MPIDAQKVQAVHAEVRGYFKGQPKAGNKGYHPLPAEALNKHDAKKPAVFKPAHWKIVPGHAQRAQRKLDIDFVDRNIGKLRGDLQSSSVTENGFKVLDQPVLIGNCNEMAEAAAYLVVLRRAGTPWIVTVEDPGDHVFCMVTDGRTPKIASVNEFALDFSGAWVIDPWANVCCEVRAFAMEFSAQMASWKKQGKFVFDVKDAKIDPASQAYLGGFLNSQLEYTRIVDYLPPGLPRAVRERKNADFQSRPGAVGI